MLDLQPDLFKNIPSELVTKLLDHYFELKQRYFLGRYEPSELNGAKFAEVVIRLLEYVANGNYTPFDGGTNLKTIIDTFVSKTKGQIDDCLRLDMTRILMAVYNVRNRRGPAHVAVISPNEMDATYVSSACDWIMAELIRFFHDVPADEAQSMINTIVERKAPLVEEFGEDMMVLHPDLSVADEILLLLYKKYPDYVHTDKLQSWIKTKHKTHVPTALNQLRTRRNINRKGDANKLTLKGITFVEKKFSSGEYVLA